MNHFSWSRQKYRQINANFFGYSELGYNNNSVIKKQFIGKVRYNQGEHNTERLKTKVGN